MHPLRQMPARLPHECGGQQGIPQAEKRDGVHPLLRVYEGVPRKGAALASIPRKIYRRGMVSSPGAALSYIAAEVRQFSN